MQASAVNKYETEKAKYFRYVQNDFLTRKPLGILLSNIKYPKINEDQKGVQKSDKTKRREIKSKNKENIWFQIDINDQKSSIIHKRNESDLGCCEKT